MATRHGSVLRQCVESGKDRAVRLRGRIRYVGSRPKNPTVAYDPTWGAGVEYFGIPFRLDYLVGMHDALGHPGVIDTWEIGWPLVSGEHRIEDVLWRSKS
jgi:hypothetical protein